jgi:dTDP-4-dehydrorhamnose 3,5-epimerase
MLPGARKDAQVVTRDWQKVHERIDGVVTREVLHVPRDHGIITEMFRPEWDPTGLPIVHIYQSRLFPAALGAWSCHAETIDRLFVNHGHLKIVLYDGREGSRSFGRLMELHVGDTRPTFLVIPVGVWHGLQNIGASEALVVNCPSRAYNYEDPDHWRLPYDSPAIPYTWPRNGTARLRSDAERRQIV